MALLARLLPVGLLFFALTASVAFAHEEDELVVLGSVGSGDTPIPLWSYTAVGIAALLVLAVSLWRLRRGTKVASLALRTGAAIVLLGLVALALPYGVNALRHPQLSSSIAAAVGGDRIGKDEVRLTMQEDRYPLPARGSAEYKDLALHATATLIRDYEERDLATAEGVTVAQSAVDKRLAAYRDEIGGEKKLQEDLEAHRLTLDHLRRIIEVDLRHDALVARRADLKVTEKEIASYYEAHKSDFFNPRGREIRYISVETRAEAERLHAKIDAGANFTEVAERYSEDAAAPLTISEGGSAEFDKIIFGLKVGAVSPVLQIKPHPWIIFQAAGPVLPAHQQTLAEARAQIRENLHGRRIGIAAKQLEQDLDRRFAGKLVYAPGYNPPGTPRGELTSSHVALTYLLGLLLALAGGGAALFGPRSMTRKVPAARADLALLSQAELYARAKSLGIAGRSRMNRAELVQAIRRAE